MAKLKVAELFYSIQGEGRYMGVPSVFLRVFGCNFQCQGFGMPKGERSTELNDVVARAHYFKDYKSLPLVSTGCDSYASWHPAFKNLSPVLDTEEITVMTKGLLPSKEWKDEHLVITGGEPLLGWQRSYPELLDSMGPNLRELTFETNGTQELTKEFRHYLLDWTLSPKHGKRGYENLTFSVSPKLSVSGEKREEAIKPDIIMQYQEIGHTYLKFVVTNEEDCNEALDVINEYRAAGFKGNVYLMPVGGVESVYAMNNKNVALLAMKHGLRYSDRLQVPLFKNEWGT